MTQHGPCNCRKTVFPEKSFCEWACLKSWQRLSITWISQKWPELISVRNSTATITIRHFQKSLKFAFPDLRHIHQFHVLIFPLCPSVAFVGLSSSACFLIPEFLWTLSAPLKHSPSVVSSPCLASMTFMWWWQSNTLSGEPVWAQVLMATACQPSPLTLHSSNLLETELVTSSVEIHTSPMFHISELTSFVCVPKLATKKPSFESSWVSVPNSSTALQSHFHYPSQGRSPLSLQ